MGNNLIRQIMAMIQSKAGGCAGPLLVLILAWSAPVAADDAVVNITLTDADRSAIHQAVESQLLAFGQDDADAAFAYASPETKKQFGTAQNFMRMVRVGYAPVYRHKSLEFGRISQVDGNVVQRVYLVGMDNVSVIALYFMEQQEDGNWLIGGCVLADKPQEKI